MVKQQMREGHSELGRGGHEEENIEKAWLEKGAGKGDEQNLAKGNFSGR